MEGEGEGIESFKRLRNSYQLSNRMALPAEALERFMEGRSALGKAAASAAAAPWSTAACTSGHRLWSSEQMSNIPEVDLGSEPAADLFAGVLTGRYAKIQAKAGRKVGLAPGGPPLWGLGWCNKRSNVSVNKLAGRLFQEDRTLIDRTTLVFRLLSTACNGPVRPCLQE